MRTHCLRNLSDVTIARNAAAMSHYGATKSDTTPQVPGAAVRRPRRDSRPAGYVTTVAFTFLRHARARAAGWSGLAARGV